MKRLSMLLLILAMVVAGIAGCGGSDSEGDEQKSMNLMDQIPGQTNMLLYVDLERMMDEVDVDGLYAQMPKEPEDPQTFDDAMDMLGIDELGEVIIFGDTAELAQSEDLFEEAGTQYLGIMVSGAFNQEQMIDAIETQTEMEMESSAYQGYTLYTDSEDEMSMAMLDDQSMILGSIAAVKDVILVREGDKSGVKGQVKSTYDDLGPGMVKLALVVPEEALESMEEEMNDEETMGINPFSMFEDITTIGLVADMEGDSMPIDARICFATEESAENMKGMLALLMGMMDTEGMDMMDPMEQAMLDMLSAMDVGVDGSCVLIGLQITPEMLEELAGSFEEGFLEGLGE